MPVYEGNLIKKENLRKKAADIRNETEKKRDSKSGVYVLQLPSILIRGNLSFQCYILEVFLLLL